MAEPDFLSGLGVDALASEPATPTRPHPHTELFLSCLESPRGIEIDCGTHDAAIALRWRLYRHRRRVAKAGNPSFDTITIRVFGQKLQLIQDPAFIVKEL